MRRATIVAVALWATQTPLRLGAFRTAKRLQVSVEE